MAILVVAPHADDEIIGCGGAIAKWSQSGEDVYVCIVTNGKPPIFDNSEAEKNNWPHNNYLETQSSNRIIGIKETFYLDYPAAMLEEVPRYELNERLINLLCRIEPSEVFIPHVGDMQKDHQIVSEAMMVAVRPKYSFAPRKLYAYETLSETGWNAPLVQNEFIPNAYVDISNYIDLKIEAMKSYQSQLALFPNARSIQAIEALARFRGATMNVMAAEAFMLLREIR